MDQPTSGFHPFCELIGLNFTACGDGTSQCRLQTDPKLFNPQRVLHGAVIYAMADTGMGAALYSVMEPGQLCATIEIKITYFKAVKTGDLICDTKILNQGKKVAYMEAEIKNDGTLVAKATGTFAVFRPSKDGSSK